MIEFFFNLLGNFEIIDILILLGDIAIWFGVYYLHAKSHIRKCQNQEVEPRLSRLRMDYTIGWMLIHLFIVFMGYELVEWGGMK